VHVANQRFVAEISKLRGGDAVDSIQTNGKAEACVAKRVAIKNIYVIYIAIMLVAMSFLSYLLQSVSTLNMNKKARQCRAFSCAGEWLIKPASVRPPSAPYHLQPNATAKARAS
jgi:hypothetical protein